MSANQKPFAFDPTAWFQQAMSAWSAAATPAQAPAGWNPARAGSAPPFDWGRMFGSGAFGGNAGQHPAGAAGSAAYAGMEDLMRQSNQAFAGLQQMLAELMDGGRFDPREVAEGWQKMLAQLGNGGSLLMPALSGGREQLDSLLAMPAFGFAREHQERLQALAAAQLSFSDQLKRYSELMQGIQQDGLRRFEARLRDKYGQQLPEGAREVFDLWIDASEEAFAEAALGPEYREIYGDLVNAQMRLQAGVQDMVEGFTAAMGMPSRTEVDSAHRKTYLLQREVRELKRRLVELERGHPAAEEQGSPAATRASGRGAATSASPAPRPVPRESAPPREPQQAAASAGARKPPRAGKAGRGSATRASAQGKPASKDAAKGNSKSTGKRRSTPSLASSKPVKPRAAKR